MVKKMQKRKNIIISILGSFLLVCLISGGALAASNNVSWPRETEDTHFYGYPEAQNNVQEFATNSGPGVAYINNGDVAWPRETEDPYFYGYPENTDAREFKTKSGATVGSNSYVTPDNVNWPRETEDPYFYAFPQ